VVKNIHPIRNASSLRSMEFQFALCKLAAQQDNTNAPKLTVSIVHVVRGLVVFAALNN
jgi:hypothetical protein